MTLIIIIISTKPAVALAKIYKKGDQLLKPSKVGETDFAPRKVLCKFEEHGHWSHKQIFFELGETKLIFLSTCKAAKNIGLVG